jgi:hypothetical protein
VAQIVQNYVGPRYHEEAVGALEQAGIWADKSQAPHIILIKLRGFGGAEVSQL